MTDVLFVDKQVIFHLPLPWCPVLWLWWIWPLSPGLPQQDSSLRNTIPPRQISFKAWYTHNQRDRSHPIMVPEHRRHFIRSQSHHCSHHDRSSSFRRHTSHSFPATAAAYATLLSMDTPITTCTMTPTGIVTPHPTLAISPADVTHAIPQTVASLTPANPTAQHRNLSSEKPNNTQDPQLSIKPPFKDCHHPGFPFRFRQWLWSFKLLESSPSSEENEWRGYSSNHYTIGLVLDCPTVTVHAEKDSSLWLTLGAAVSLATIVNTILNWRLL